MKWCQLFSLSAIFVFYLKNTDSAATLVTNNEPLIVQETGERSNSGLLPQPIGEFQKNENLLHIENENVLNDDQSFEKKEQGVETIIRVNDETETKSGKENGNIPFLQSSGADENKNPGGNLPFLQGGNIPQIPGAGGNGIPFIPGGGNFAEMIPGMGNNNQSPKLVWGGFFFVETPLNPATLASMASLMQSGQQMIPGGLPTQMLPIPGAG